MVRKELSETEIAESIPDLWQPLTQEQREFLVLVSLITAGAEKGFVSREKNRRLLWKNGRLCV